MSGDWYSVHIEARAPEGAAAVIQEEAVDQLMDLLEEHSGGVTSGTVSWGATISVQALTVLDGTSRASAIISSMAEKAHMPDWPMVRAEAVREDILGEDLERPTLPELVSAPEAAEILGVSPQRVRELARGGRVFPSAVYELKVGKLWLRDAIVAYGERRETRPGRPDKAAALREQVTSALFDCGMTMMDALVTLNDDRLVVLQIRTDDRRLARHWAAKALSAMSDCGLAVRPDVSYLADDLEVYLASGHPVVVFEQQDEAHSQAAGR